jgi:hypothetical protein
MTSTSAASSDLASQLREWVRRIVVAGMPLIGRLQVTQPQAASRAPRTKPLVAACWQPHPASVHKIDKVAVAQEGWLVQ